MSFISDLIFEAKDKRQHRKQNERVGIKARSEESARIPDNYSEQRLRELRDEAERFGRVKGTGARPEGAPFPRATPSEGYYGIHLLKEPQWTWEIPFYFFVGGAGGAAAVIAEAARISGGEESKIVRDARTVAAVGALLSPTLLVADLGVRRRFLYMLRVFKPQSPMSVGVYIVSGFSTFAVLTKLHQMFYDRFPQFDLLPMRVAQELSSSLAALFGLGMATYTGVLIGATVVPVWNDHVASLPVHFAASGVNSAVGAIELLGNDNRALNAIGIGSAAVECLEGYNIERRESTAAEPLKHGISGMMQRLGGVLSGPVPLVLRIASLFRGKEGARKLRRAAAISSIAGSVITRYAWVEAGHASTRDHRLPLQLAPDQFDLPDNSQPPWARKPELPPISRTTAEALQATSGEPKTAATERVAKKKPAQKKQSLPGSD